MTISFSMYNGVIKSTLAKYVSKYYMSWYRAFTTHLNCFASVMMFYAYRLYFSHKKTQCRVTNVRVFHVWRTTILFAEMLYLNNIKSSTNIILQVLFSDNNLPWIFIYRNFCLIFRSLIICKKYSFGLILRTTLLCLNVKTHTVCWCFDGEKIT